MLELLMLLQPSPVPIPGPDLSVMGIGMIGAAFTIALTPLATWGVRKALPKLPRIAVPFLAMVLGVGITYLDKAITGGTFSPVIGAALGGLGVTLREILNTFNEHGVN